MNNPRLQIIVLFVTIGTFFARSSALRAMRGSIRRSDILRRAYYRMRLFGSKSESDEYRIISTLTHNVPRTFIEFGFHPIEFNCAELARRPDWRGLLVDRSEKQVVDARMLWPNRVAIVRSFLTLDNLKPIRNQFQEIGVLSIDVDGNDYWFLKALIDLSPSLIVVEYNSTLGFEPITVPYDPLFDRHEKHPHSWYHGASLTALTKLCAEHGYGLAAGSDGSCNAFFTKDGNLRPEEVWKPKDLRAKLSGISHENQWSHVKHLPFVRV
jgi:hypothetical protein